MNSYFFELINENLFPKIDHKSSNIIESSEVFINSLFENYKSSYKDIHLEHTHFRQIIYGLASTKKNESDFLFNLKSFLSKNYLRQEVNEFIEQLKSEKKIVDILQENYQGIDSLYLKVSDWQKIIYSELTNSVTKINPNHQSKNEISPFNIKQHLDNFYYGSEFVKEQISRIFYEHNFKVNGLKVLPKKI